MITAHTILFTIAACSLTVLIGGQLYEKFIN
jgi:hypothetical protein